MKYFLAGIGLLFSLNTFSQIEVEVNFFLSEGYLFEEEAPYHYVLGDQVSLRSCPSESCGLINILGIGSKLITLEKSDSFTIINGIKSKWYKVRTSDGYLGWIWGGYIAQNTFGSTADPEVKFVTGYEKVAISENGNRLEKFYQFRAYKNGKQLDKIVVQSFSWEFDNVTHHGNLGLKNVDDIITIRVPCTGGCGCSTGEIYIFWNKGTFYHAMDAIGMADAEYSEYESFIFPSHMEGEPGYIIKKTGTVVENENYNEEMIRRKATTEYYTWNGKKLVRSKREPIVKTYWLED